MAITTYKPDGTVQAVTGNLNTELGKQSLAQLGTPTPVPQITDAARLSNTQTLQVPPPVQSNIANQTLGAAVDTVVNGLEEQNSVTQSTKVTPQGEQISRIGGLLEKLGLKGAKTAQVQQEEGVFEKKKEVTDLENKIRAKKLAYTRQIENLQANKQGKFGGAVEQDVANLERAGNRELADLAIQYQAASGNYKDAFDIAEAKIKAEFEPLQDEINNRTNLYNLMQNDLSEKEKMQMQADIQQKQTELNYQFDVKLAQEKDKIEQANPMFAANLANVYDQIRSRRAGDLLAQQKAAADAPGGTTTVFQQAQAKGNIDLANNLVNDKYLSAAVGPNRSSRLSVANIFTGGRGNFVAGVEQLRSQLSLDSLIQAKAKGATFGALSEGELNILSNSATRIGSWAIKDKDKNVVGYRTSEANFKKEMDKINNFAKLDFLLKGGDPATIGVKTMPDGTLWTANSDGTFTQLK